MKEILRFLCENYWQLTNDAKHFILENTDEIRVAAGEVLLKPGEPCNYVWFIKSGLLRAYQEHYDEKRGIMLASGSQGLQVLMLQPQMIAALGLPAPTDPDYPYK